MNRIENLLNQMTLKEKIAQMQQLDGRFFGDGSTIVTGPESELKIDQETVDNCGSVLGVSGARRIREIQAHHLAHSRLGIPLLFMGDVIHGSHSIFPVPLGQACSFDPELVESMAAAAGKEAAATGLHVVFSPMVDLVRDPRWGRVMESGGGEDPFLNQVMARAMVRGYQGTNLDEIRNPEKVAACVKHYGGYGAAEGGREYNTVDLSWRIFRDFYLPPFAVAVDEGVRMVMSSFNILDSVPAMANRTLMRTILRDELEFRGITISDWGAAGELIPHGVASDEKDAARLSLEAGVDIEMMTACYVHELEKLVSENPLLEERINEAVRRILALKEELGLFDDPYRQVTEEREQQTLLQPETLDLAEKAAAQSAVLLRNVDTLPFDKPGRIALVGPMANSRDLLGPWSWHGDTGRAATILEVFQERWSGEVTLLETCGIDDLGTSAPPEEIEGMGFRRFDPDSVRADLEILPERLREFDYVLLCLGESSNLSGEGGSRSDIRLPGLQEELVKAASASGVPTAAVVIAGRPLDLRVLDRPGISAVLWSFYPGTRGAAALCDLITGRALPEGKLAMSIPWSAGQIPVYYNAFNTGRPMTRGVERNVTHYLDCPNEARYAFGHGLTYGDARIETLNLSHSVVKLGSGDAVQAEVTLTNHGKRQCRETVQLYIRDLAASVVRPVKELKAFEKVNLKPGETKTVTFSLTEDILGFVGSDLRFRTEPGRFRIMAGLSSDQLIQADLMAE